MKNFRIMESRQERFAQAYDYLRDRGFFHKQKDLAKIMGTTEPNISSAKKGDEKVLTDRFLKRFNNSFGNPFSESWLLAGEGEMLKAHIVQHADGDNNTQVAGYGNSVNFSSALDKALDEIAEQRKLLAEQIQINKEQNEKIIDLINKIQK